MKKSSKSGDRRSAAQMHALAAVRREIIARDGSGGRKYLREYSQSFRHYRAVLSPEQLQEKMSAASILLVGDYHALHASQRYTASLIEQLAAKRRVILAVEAVLSRDQSIVDSWWRREIDAQELRTRLRFDHDWGYAWEPFYDLLVAARDHAEGIYGLDCMPRHDMRRIRSRDHHAATKICEMRQRHPDAVIFVLFGESHMAPEHLPQRLKQTLPQESVITVLQNVDALYWQAVSENASAVEISDDVFCVFNSSPLEKYESYRLCLERWNGEEHVDFAPAVYNLIFSLARTLGFRIDSPRNGTQPKYLADSLPEVVNISEHGDERLSGVAAGELEAQGCLYTAESNTFFVREFRMPDIAAESTRFLHQACRGMKPAESPLAVPIESALACFGARLLCPGTTAESHVANSDGDTLYMAYLEGRVTRLAVRRMFLADLADAETSRAILAQIRSQG